MEGCGNSFFTKMSGKEEKMKYAHKLSVIEALQYDGDFVHSDGTPYSPEWIFDALETGKLVYIGVGELYNASWEEVQRVDYLDYILLVEDGKLYSLKPDVFEANYEKIN